MLGTAAKDKLSLVPLSTEIVKNRIDDISEDILHQVVADLKASHTKFSLQLHETTDGCEFEQAHRICTLRYRRQNKRRVSLQTPYNNCKSHRRKKDFGRLLHK